MNDGKLWTGNLVPSGVMIIALMIFPEHNGNIFKEKALEIIGRPTCSNRPIYRLKKKRIRREEEGKRRKEEEGKRREEDKVKKPLGYSASYLSGLAR